MKRNLIDFDALNTMSIICLWLQQLEVPFVFGEKTHPDLAPPKLRVWRHWLESITAKRASSSSGRLIFNFHLMFYNVYMHAVSLFILNVQFLSGKKIFLVIYVNNKAAHVFPSSKTLRTAKKFKVKISFHKHFNRTQVNDICNGLKSNNFLLFSVRLHFLAYIRHI